MSVWLSPQELSPIYGGTYYPKQHFMGILERLSELWQANADQLVQKSKYVIEQLSGAMIKDEVDDNICDSDKVFESTYNKFNQRFDKALGGFGQAPKFPRPVEIDFLLRYYYKNQDNDKGKNALKMCIKTLDGMANGGMYDHLGGGFHRYSVDEYFHVPHFEKMLYDNAQLIITYLNAFKITKNYFYKKVAMETLNYILRDMKMPNGGIYSAEDADSLDPDDMKEKKEGSFYVWKEAEFDKLLTKNEAIILKQLYFIQQNGNTILSVRSDPHKEFVGLNVLYKKTNDLIEVYNKVKGETDGVESLNDVEKLIKSGNQKLFEYRAKRPRPHLDNKIICAWNGLILSSFAVAHKVLHFASDSKDDKPDIYLKTAKEIAQFIYDKMRDDQTGFLYRIFGKTDIYGFSIDYSFLIKGLLDLYEACFEPKWLKWAIELQDIQNTLFFDQKLGAYFDTVENSKNLIMRLKEEYDGAEPCPSSIAVQNLLRLYNFTKKDDYLKVYGKKTLQYLSSTLDKMPFAIPAACNALESYQNGLKQVVISSVDNQQNIGDFLDDEKDDARKQGQISSFLNVLYGGYYPDTVCIMLNGKNYHEMKDEVNEMYGFFTCDKSNNVMGHVCQQFACQRPTNDIKEFESQLSGNNQPANDEDEGKTN